MMARVFICFQAILINQPQVFNTLLVILLLRD
jgi:hypothetical protein